MGYGKSDYQVYSHGTVGLCYHHNNGYYKPDCTESTHGSYYNHYFIEYRSVYGLYFVEDFVVYFWILSINSITADLITNSKSYILGTKIIHTADFAFGFSCVADCSSVKHQSVAKIVAFLRRKKVTKHKFNFLWVFNIVYTQSVGKPDTVGVNHNRRLSENIAYNKVCGFSAYARKLCKLFDCVRHNTVVVITETLSHKHNIPCLGFVKSAAFYIFLYFGNIGIGKIFGGFKPFKESRSNHVYTVIGTLSRKTCCNQKL